jgi:NTP pyrophosphatase (non-canonical NTP hydrolase)
MLTNEKIELIIKAIKLYGVDGQYIQMAEETGEMLTAISQFRRGRVQKQEVIEEFADVLLMMDCFKVLLSISDKELDDMVELKYKKFESQIE